MKNLERTVVGNFNIEQSFLLQELENRDEKFYENNIISIEKVFSDTQKILLEKRKLIHFLNGVMLTQKTPNGLYKVYCEDKFIGLGTVRNELLKRDIILD